MTKLKRIIKNIKNYFSSIEKSKQSVGQINRGTKEGQMLESLIKQNNIAKVLEIGTWNGLGSTKTILEVLQENIDEYYFTSIESDKIFYNRALKNLKEKLESAGFSVKITKPNLYMSPEALPSKMFFGFLYATNRRK